jgi:cytochrome b561
MSNSNPSIKRYNPVLVALHWLTPIFIFAPLFVIEGGEGRGSSSMKLHMIYGIVALVVIAIRLFMRLSTKHPEWATTGVGFLDHLGKWVHYALYFFLFVVTISGIVIALRENRLGEVFGVASTARLTADQMAADGVLGFVSLAHGLGWFIMMPLMLLHIGGAFYHQVFVKDGLLSRMWFGSQAG